MFVRRARILLISVPLLLAACSESTSDPAALVASNAARGVNATFLTAEGAQARLVAGVSGEIVPLVTVGDVMPGSGLPVAPIPDGIGAWGGQRYLNLMMNHELSGSGVNGQFRNARVSHFQIDTKTLQIVSHRYVIDGSEGYARFCSAAWVDARDGFPGGYYFTGEEEEDGTQLAVDRQGRVTEMPWIGKYAHENQISIPGFTGSVAVLNFDDNGGNGTGVSASLSEVYMYVASNADNLMRGNGQLYVFASDDVDHPGELSPGDRIQGRWIAVPEEVALGSHQGLEAWVDQAGAFPFVRVEDGFYDKRPRAKPAAYFFDTGRSSILDETGTAWDKWGSIYRLEFDDRSNPAAGASLTLLARSAGPASGWASPDNGDMNADGVLMLQEDPAASPWLRRPAIFRFQVAGNGSLVNTAGEKVVEVVDPVAPDNAAAVFGWETSGIVDASEWFGAGAWIFDTQAHQKAVPSLGLTAENGQLLLLRLQ